MLISLVVMSWVPMAPRSSSRAALRVPGDRAVGEAEQMIAFVAVQPQRPGEGGRHLDRRLDVAATFQLGVVVHGHSTEIGDLFTP
jgi:hypothetical protein